LSPNAGEVWQHGFDAINQRLDHIASGSGELGGQLDAKPAQYSGEGSIKQAERRPIDDLGSDAGNTAAEK